ncbi:Fpg/Nei family DNA glycosylase [Agromyces sp. CFH 90414]|uniref:Fpg/Nei family DNA glycosylase n=1 Tax=Agromyces agglutinans TaxID=2662258 RepID=A0A6I2FE34_9MICO|nr:DNA-formamidopyrimidine glycosylase family protein [Agromyces agglutinans]MRG60950.1 Fpg/Nei family DNA glycosylase [Agromyces agglutinans]
MPESPEVQALVEELDARLAGRALTGVDVLEFRTTKSRSRLPASLIAATVSGVARHGKLVDLAFGDAGHLVISLGRHGWARWADASGGAEAAAAAATGPESAAPDAAAPADPPPALVSLSFDDGATLELTDAGNWVSLGTWVVDRPDEVPAVAKLGPDPADADFSRERFEAAVAGRRKQVKAVLQEQESLAGIGNAYSDEVLHRAKVSPVVHAAALDEAELARLFSATTGVVREAIEARRGVPIAQLKAAKVAAMRAHGRAGEACPVCGDDLRDFSFASTTAQYCPTCQTGGELLPLKGGEG